MHPTPYFITSSPDSTSPRPNINHPHPSSSSGISGPLLAPPITFPFCKQNFCQNYCTHFSSVQTRQNSLFRPSAGQKPVEITNVHVHCTHFNCVQTRQNSFFRPSAGRKPVDISKCTNLFLFSFLYPGLLCLLGDSFAFISLQCTKRF